LPPDDLTVDVTAFGDNAVIDLDTGETVNVRAWLESGEDPVPVIELARSQRHTL